MTSWLDDVGYPVSILCYQGIQVQGYLYTGDPNTNNLLLLSNYNPNTTKFNTLTLVMGPTIQKITRVEENVEEPITNRIQQATDLEQVLECTREEKGNTLDQLGPDETEQRKNNLLQLLNKCQWNAEWDPTTGVVQVMDGLVRIEPPYTKECCFSTQQNVLLQMYSLLEEL